MGSPLKVSIIGFYNKGPLSDVVLESSCLQGFYSFWGGSISGHKGSLW